MTGSPSRTAEIRRLAAVDEAGARAALAALLSDLFGIEVRDLAINRDRYSLNSLNGVFASGGDRLFFKFHQEDGEEAMAGEYYRADVLARAGLPVDQPVLLSRLPGEQILVYRRRDDPRFSDVLRALDLAPDPAAAAEAVAAERALCRRILAVYRESLHPVTASEVRAEPIHQLFHGRLVDGATGAAPGGRWAAFYIGRTVELPGVRLPFETFAAATVAVNGQRYRHPVGALFAAALDRLAPGRLADAGGVTAHGDAHNANVWYVRRPGGGADLAFYDPAFAGTAVPSLLAEVKATFHNTLAHPLWLYDPAEATDRFSARASYRDGVLAIETDFDWPALRRELLAAKAEEVWRPLLALLKARDMLPTDWETVIRLALFLCPTLVMSLLAGAGGHTPVSSAIAWSVAVMAGSPPEEGEDPVTAFFAAIAP